MFKPTGNVTALELGWHIVHAVRSAMPIGSDNLTGQEHNMLSSQARTNGWSKVMVTAMRGRSYTDLDKEISCCGGKLTWLSKKIGNERRTWQMVCITNSPSYWFYSKYDPECDSDEQFLLQNALYATLFKAGNCCEMTSLAFMKFCQYFASFPDTAQVPSFFLEKVDLPTPPFDHTFIKLTFRRQVIICDPWINHAFELNDENLENWNKMFGPDGLFIASGSSNKEELSAENRDRLWKQLKSFLNTHPCSLTKIAFSTRKHAKKLANLFDVLYQRTIELAHQQKIFDADARSSALMWQGRYLFQEHDRLLNISKPNYYEKTNLKLIEAFLDEYEFPDEFDLDEVHEHVGFIFYMQKTKDFLPKESAERYFNLLEDEIKASMKKKRVNP